MGNPIRRDEPGGKRRKLESGSFEERLVYKRERKIQQQEEKDEEKKRTKDQNDDIQRPKPKRMRQMKLGEMEKKPEGERYSEFGGENR